MNVICFTPKAAQLQRLSSTVFNSLQEDDVIEIYNSLESLFARLRRPIPLDCFMILCPQTMRQIQNFIACKEFFRARIILVLPREANDWVSCVHVLSPSFTIYDDQDFTPISAVAEKLRAFFEKKQKRPNNSLRRKRIDDGKQNDCKPLYSIMEQPRQHAKKTD